jgi:uncharacterized protein YdcH (DUF465 family)
MTTLEKIKYHISYLEEKHIELDRRIDRMELTGRFTDDELSPMKRERLRIKDEIARLKETTDGQS